LRREARDGAELAELIPKPKINKKTPINMALFFIILIFINYINKLNYYHLIDRLYHKKRINKKRLLP
jgi:hypothetical protein